MHNTSPVVSCSIPCDLCGSTDVESIRWKDRHGDQLRSVICRHCGLVWTDPRPTPEEVREFYAREYRLHYKGAVQPKARHTFRAGQAAIARCQRLQSVLRPGFEVLDVGAGSGELVYMLRAAGYNASGFEPNAGYARHAAETLGLPVQQGFWQDANIPTESKDMVTMFHTVEHFEAPFTVMRHARQWLKPGGWLWIEVPNVEAICQFPHTQFHRGHLYHFNLATLGAMVQRAGYTVAGRSTSQDGGNITIHARKANPPVVEPATIPGNYQRVSSILRRHTAFRHWFSRHPYLRPLSKLAARWQEQRGVWSSRSARGILDALIAKAGWAPQ